MMMILFSQNAIEFTVIGVTSIFIAFHSLQAFPQRLASPALYLIILSIISMGIEYFFCNRKVQSMDKSTPATKNKQTKLHYYDVYIGQQRQSPSSGIALGIVTLPWLATSLASRSILYDEVNAVTIMISPILLSSMSMYCALAGSVSILAFLFFLFKTRALQQCDNVATTPNLFRVAVGWIAFVGCCAYSYSTLDYNSLSFQSSFTGMLLYSISSVIAFHCMVVCIPKTFTLGESILVSQGLVQLMCYIGILGMHVVRHGFILFDVYRNFVACMVFATCSVALVSSIMIITAIPSPYPFSTHQNIIHSAILIICSCYWIAMIGLGIKTALWVLNFVAEDSKRVFVIGMWVLLLVMSLPLMILISRSGRVKNIIGKSHSFPPLVSLV